MFDRDDPLNYYLSVMNYNAVRFPRSDIKPLQLFARYKTGMHLFSEFTTLFQTNVSPLTITENMRVASISGKRTNSVKAKIGISIMETFIQAMSGSSIGLASTLREAASITFEFSNVLEDAVDLGQIDICLNACSVNPHAHSGKVLLEQDKIYVVTRTLKSREFTTEITKSNGKSLSVDVPLIQQIMGGNVGVDAGTTEHLFKLTFKGRVPLVFGLQAIQLFYSNSQFFIHPARALFVTSPSPIYLENDGTLLSLDDSK